MKAVLVLNDMPEKCINCPLCRVLDEDDFESVAMACKIIGYQEDFEKKPENCPLKEMPKEKEVPFADKLMFITELSKEDTYNIGKAEGWNDCLDNILGKEE